MIHEERIRYLNGNEPVDGDFVLYWMQASQRAFCNHALEYAIERANALGQPLVTGFGLTPSYPEANLRHYTFMLEGLQETAAGLAVRGIRFLLLEGSPEKAVTGPAGDASLIVTDRGYLTIQKEWRSTVAARVPCPLVQVESDVVVPVETASPKEEWSAATLRRRIHRLLPDFLVPLGERTLYHPSVSADEEQIPFGKILASLPVDRSIRPSLQYRGGISEARRHLHRFLEDRLARFSEERNDPNADVLSNMSPYLHFGQISPLSIALKVAATGSPNADAYLEELIVRRELAMNFVHYNPAYDSFDGLPAWAKQSLRDHWGDRRAYLYSLEELESARTHDRYWNAAQQELVTTGKLHGYMRMYWGKKIIEWTKNPAVAYYIALYLNNRYELDGRDPNGYTGVAWCFGKHDRAWREREIFGKVRYMNANGLRRKFDVEAYVERMRRLAEPARPVKPS
jgi:deoxyribodipyrimidine photo-lyase